jgi:cysteine desulfurase
MFGSRTYLDHNATAPLRPEAREAMLAAIDLVGNPSSVHAEGRRARAIVEEARERVARLVGAATEEVVFTSGATEANNWVIRAGWDAVVAAPHEHDSVLAPARSLGASPMLLPVGTTGVADIAWLQGPAAPRAGNRGLLSLHLANAETGVLQPVAEAVATAPGGFLVHTDAVQAVGRVPVDFRTLGVALMSVSAHKLGGPKGIGALVIRSGVDLPPLLAGGGQERRRRSGTENVAAIAGFGAAARAARFDPVDAARIKMMRDRLEEEVKAITPSACFIGAESPRLPNTSCIAIPETDATTLLIRLDLEGVAVSAGSACSSGKIGRSHVLEAMSVQDELARAAIRVSLGTTTTDDDIDRFLAAWSTIHTPRATRSETGARAIRVDMLPRAGAATTAGE